MKLIRCAAKWLGIVAVVFAAVIAIVVVQDPSRYYRYFTLAPKFLTAGPADFSPQATIRGARAAWRLPPEPRPDAAAALESAARLAAAADGRALIVLHRGRLVYERYWGGWTAATTTNSHSLAKTVAALTLGAALRAGCVHSVDDPISRYLPALRDARRSIRFRDALHMASGLERIDNTKINPFSQVVKLTLTGDQRGAVLGLKQQSRPGTVFHYANYNPNLVAMGVEAACGGDYRGIVGRRVWGPLGNPDVNVWIDHEGGWWDQGNYLFATPRDWARVGAAIASGGVSLTGTRVVDTSFIDAMAAPSPANPHYGFFVWRPADGQPSPDPISPDMVPRRPFADPDLIVMRGAMLRRVYISRRTGTVIVFIAAPDPRHFPPRAWDESALPNLIIPTVAAE